ncbi:MAG: hypothetical protein JEZ07_03395 [Phycisphaerae bacterium]|nr:hypothetical protein [Phycisphaerae bacterium]
MDTTKDIKPILSWFSNEIEPDDVEFEWEYLLDNLDELIKEINPDGYWFCKVKNFGWKKISGYVFLKFNTAKDLLSRVLPNTDCSFNIFKEDNILKIQNFHHDSPTGKEWYELTPISYEQYENQTM